MGHKYKEMEEVYAVLRFDAFHASAEARPEDAVTVKEVLRSKETAEAEVKRLNQINSDKNVRYWWQQTKLFLECRSAGKSSD